MTLYVSSLIVGISDNLNSKDLHALISKIKKLPQVNTVKVAVEYVPELEHSALSRVYDQPVSVLGLSTRPSNVLMTENIRTVGELTQLKSHELLKLPGLGRRGLNEIESALSCFDLSLAKNEQ